jgi:hypothetical protein
MIFPADQDTTLPLHPSEEATLDQPADGLSLGDRCRIHITCCYRALLLSHRTAPTALSPPTQDRLRLNIQLKRAAPFSLPIILE